MPKKATSKNIQKNETEDDYDIDDEEYDDNDLDNELDDDLDDDIKDDYIELDTDTNAGIVDENAHEDDEYFEYDEDINDNNINVKEYVSAKERISINRLTKYEMVRILGERTKQLTMGAKAMIKNYNGLSYDKIAEEEFKLNMIPFKLVRVLPNGNRELWNLNELKKEHLYSQLD
jgi:DNA-directed RNA polymerase subunit K/omega